MPNSRGNSSFQVRRPAKRSNLVSGRISAMATPEIRNSSDIRQRLTNTMGHCSHSAVCTLLRWKPQSST
ncbi:hypothetical protein D3C73_987230 [compost metagenome]